MKILSIFPHDITNINGARARSTIAKQSLVTYRCEKIWLWCQRTYVRPSVQTLGEGEGSPKTTRRGVANTIFFLAGNCTVLLGNRRFSWREVAWPPSLLKKRATDSVLQKWSLELEEKISNIYKWKENVQKYTPLSFWWKAKSSSYEICLPGFHLCCQFCCKLGRSNAWFRSISQRSRHQI